MTDLLYAAMTITVLKYIEYINTQYIFILLISASEMFEYRYQHNIILSLKPYFQFLLGSHSLSNQKQIWKIPTIDPIVDL